MKQCTECGRPLEPHIFSERVGEDYFCVPCSNAKWDEKRPNHRWSAGPPGSLDVCVDCGLSEDQVFKGVSDQRTTQRKEG